MLNFGSCKWIYKMLGDVEIKRNGGTVVNWSRAVGSGGLTLDEMANNWGYNARPFRQWGRQRDMGRNELNTGGK